MPRKPFGKFFELIVLSCLDQSIPRTVEFIRRSVAERLGRPGLSWHTVRKYLIALRDMQKIEEIHAGEITTFRLRKQIVTSSGALVGT